MWVTQSWRTLLLCLSLTFSGSLFAAETASTQGGVRSQLSLDLDALDPNLKSAKGIIDEILKSDPSNADALALKNKLGKKPTFNVGDDFKEFEWNSKDVFDGPYIEIPDEEITVQETLEIDPRNKEALDQLKSISEKKYSLASFFASLEGDRWGGGFRVGLYNPSLDDLNQGVFLGPISGEGSIFVDPDTPSDGNENSAFSFSNDIPAMDWATEAGVEFRWDIDRKHSYIIGLGSWEGNSQSALKEIALPIQNLITRADLVRRAQFSFTQLYVGWKYNIFQWPDRLRVYTRLTVNEYFDIDYREDHIYTFREFDIDGFKRILIVRTQTTGAFAFSGGLGAEYFVKDWMSLGFEVERVVSVASFNLKNVVRNSDFSDDEQNAFNQLPYAFDASGNMLLRRPDGSEEEVKLRFDSWKYIFNVTFYY